MELQQLHGMESICQYQLRAPAFHHSALRQNEVALKWLNLAGRFLCRIYHGNNNSAYGFLILLRSELSKHVIHCDAQHFLVKRGYSWQYLPP